MEHSNAAEWDLHRRPNTSPARGDAADGWQTVSKPDKGKGKATSTPAAASSSITKTSKTPREHYRRDTGRSRGTGKWQDWKGRPIKPPEHPRAPKLIDDDSGNDAQDQWRAQKPERVSLRIPKALLIADGLDALQSLARQHLCYVAILDKQVSGPDSQAIGIWGAEKTKVDATRVAINKWIEEVMGPQKSGRAAKFAKLTSMTPILRERAEKRWAKEVKLQRYRQHPPLNTPFGAIGTFHWPVKDYAPREILGSSYEALDPIRMDTACYVVGKKTGFQVMGKSMDKVKEALLRLRQTVFQIAAKQLPTTRMYLLQGRRPQIVRLEEYNPIRQLNGPATAEIKQHPVVQGDGTHGDGTKQSLASERRTRAAVMRTLDRLPHYRGTIKMRMHFGRFLVAQYMLPENGSYELEEYEAMAKESQFQGLITDELGDREIEHAALSSLQRRGDDLLIPPDHNSIVLSDVQPFYTAIFRFADDKLGDLQLTKSWQLAQVSTAGSPHFDVISEKWERLDRETQSSTSLVDICLTDLSTSFGWAVSIDAAQAVDGMRLSQRLINFAANLSIDHQAASRRTTDKPFVKFNAYVHGTVLKHLEQRITYPFRMRDFDYNVELSRFQRFDYAEKKKDSATSYVGSQPPKIFEPRWSFGVFRTEWDTAFAENERLAVGTKASWSRDSERWFPKGFADPEAADKSYNFSSVLRDLNKLAALLRDGGKAEDLLGGMTIG